MKHLRRLIKLPENRFILLERYDYGQEISLRILPAGASEKPIDGDYPLLPGGLLATARFNKTGGFFDVRSYIEVGKAPNIVVQEVEKGPVELNKWLAFESPFTGSGERHPLLSGPTHDFKKLSLLLGMAVQHALSVRHFTRSLPFEIDQDANVFAEWCQRVSAYIVTWRHLVSVGHDQSPFHHLYGEANED